VTLLKGLIPFFQKRTPAPVLTEGEVAAAVRRFRALEPLCEVEPFAHNDGFGAAVSFRTTTHNSSLGLGSLEVGLRTAALEFRAPPDITGWSWSDAVPPFVREHRGLITRQTVSGEKTSDLESKSKESELSAEGGLSAPIAKASVRGSRKSGRRRDQTQEISASTTVTRTIPKALVEIDGVRSPFVMRLMAPEENDLGYFNTDLTHQGFLKVPEPSSLDLKSVQVQLRLPVIESWSDELVHSLSIRKATGAWAPLVGSRDNQILTELLFSKFLRRLHRPARLWPRRRGKPG
jgi:hypothetical protein